MIPPRGQQPSYNLHLISRWVASNTLRCFQLPAAKGSREACGPHIDPASPITKCEDKQTAARRAGSMGPRRARKFIVTDEKEKRKGFFRHAPLFLVLQKLLGEEIEDLVELFIGIRGSQKLLAVFHNGL